MEEIVKERLQVEKNIERELSEIRKIIKSAESDDVKYGSIESILKEMVVELNQAKSEHLYESRTGFLSPKFGEDFLKKEIEVGKRYDRKFSLSLLDIDHLKFINDHYGHVEGTKAIMAVSRAIKKCLRKSDVTCRYGGDEFMIIFVGTEIKKAEIAVSRIQNQLKIESKNIKPNVTVSFGTIEVGPKGKNTVSSVIKKADARLYLSKEDRPDPNENA